MKKFLMFFPLIVAFLWSIMGIHKKSKKEIPLSELAYIARIRRMPK